MIGRYVSSNIVFEILKYFNLIQLPSWYTCYSKTVARYCSSVTYRYALLRRTVVNCCKYFASNELLHSLQTIPNLSLIHLSIFNVKKLCR